MRAAQPSGWGVQRHGKERNVGFTPTVTTYGQPGMWIVLYLNCGSYGLLSVLRSKTFWLSFGVALDLGREVSFASSLGTPLSFMGLFNTARNICWLSPLKSNKIFKRIFFFNVALCSEVGQIRR